MKRIALFLTIFFIYACENNIEKNNSTYKEPAVVKLPQDSLEQKDSTVTFRDEKQTYVQAYNKSLTLWEIPFEEKEVKTNLGNAHVIVCGPVNAEPVVLLHGMNASSTMWYPNIKSLSQQYRVYAIDFFMEPGKSAYQGKVNHTDQIVNWYYEIFDQLNLKKINLVGASRGGWLAINIALHSKSRINKIALLSPAQTFFWIKPGAKVISNITYSISPKRKRLRSVMQTMTFDIDKINEIYINQYYLATKKATLHTCFLQMTPFSDKQLESLNMPVLVLIG
ncbi:MAG TPA: alpha/beta hydrolase, partial [Bacteroidia bacterium]|nr:alpha/beta hydrolase [Bacteroidia bacterium]